MMNLTTQDSKNLADAKAKIEAARKALEAAVAEYNEVVEEIVEANDDVTPVEEKRLAYDFTGAYTSRR